jgi:hypothetical protein
VPRREPTVSAPATVSPAAGTARDRTVPSPARRPPTPSPAGARERAARRQETGKRSDQPARLVEGQRVMGWRGALNELAYPGRLR